MSDIESKIRKAIEDINESAAELNREHDTDENPCQEAYNSGYWECAEYALRLLKKALEPEPKGFNRAKAAMNDNMKDLGEWTVEQIQVELAALREVARAAKAMREFAQENEVQITVKGSLRDVANELQLSINLDAAINAALAVGYLPEEPTP